MTVKQARTEFLDNLDRQTLEAINQRIEKLAPLVAEHGELCRRRRALETKHGINRTSERIVNLLAEYPQGLSSRDISRMLDREPGAIRSSCADLVNSGLLVRISPGVFGMATS